MNSEMRKDIETGEVVMRCILDKQRRKRERLGERLLTRSQPVKELAVSRLVNQNDGGCGRCLHSHDEIRADARPSQFLKNKLRLRIIPDRTDQTHRSTQNSHGPRSIGSIAAGVVLNRSHPARGSPGRAVERVNQRVVNDAARTNDARHPHTPSRSFKASTLERGLESTGTRWS